MELRPIREKRGFSIASIATMMGVAKNTVSRWETGEREPDIETLKKLATLYRCTLDELVYGLKPSQESEEEAENPCSNPPAEADGVQA